ncbi:MAG TPA: Lrp/AsnC family transcriptional regulator [Lysobacter sp.]|nr:Lrp/AsnC family transcriptional regulator [Lysobacter sp.]
MKVLDDIDRRLIALLQDDARRPAAVLAREVGLSRSAVQERLQRLQDSGVIAGYGVRLGQPPDTLLAWLTLRHAEGFTCEDVLPALAEMPQVQLCHSMAGDADMLVLVRVASPEALARLRETVLGLKGVDDVTTAIVLRTLLDRR